MGRIANVEESERELLEADLGRLGLALVYLRLVMERVNLAAQNGQGHLLHPAVEDLRTVGKLIKETQQRIALHSK